jgi:endonuclease-3
MAGRVKSPAPPAAPRRRAPGAPLVVDRLARVFPGATTELVLSTPFALLVATILSAQSTDARVNQVTPALFARFPTPQALAASDPRVVENLIKSTGFFRQKSRAIVGAAAAIAERHAGRVPSSMEALVALPGVGRKTANVVLGHAFGVPGLPVDRHVLRVANRIGIVAARTPERAEEQLCAALPPDKWTLASDCLILHGRRVCRPKPLCARCVLQDTCLYYASGAAPAPAPRAERAVKTTKARAAAPGRPPARPRRKPRSR